jgi:hypothetical protein
MMIGVTFAIPEGPPIELELRPRLESWNRRDDPDQVALREFVAHVHERIDPIIDATDGLLAFRLDVGLPDNLDPLWERDLDNYLFPIARTLPDRVVSVWGTKRRGPSSTVHLEPAVSAAASGWQEFRVPRSPAGERLWKATVREAVRAAIELPEGPVALQLALTIGPGRSWPAMWKASIDGLEPLLGRTHAGRDWNPLDGRIVRLGLHKAVDGEFHKEEAAMVVRARMADECWPELQWLSSLDASGRLAFREQHRAKQRLRFERPAPPRVASFGTEHQPRLPSEPSAPAGRITEFTDDDDGYRGWVAANPGGWVTNIQRRLNPSDARVHSAGCRTIAGTPPGATWTGPYIKVCAVELSELDAWAITHVGRTIIRCGTCQPPSA